MNDTEYNGWTNYATWRVNLEIFDDLFDERTDEISADECEDYAKMIIDNGSTESLALDDAFAFLNQVNWQEIADSVNQYN